MRVFKQMDVELHTGQQFFHRVADPLEGGRFVHGTCLTVPMLEASLRSRVTNMLDGQPAHRYTGNESPNIGLPLLDCSPVASSWMTSQCSTRTPSSIRRMSAAIQFTGAPNPENRP